MPHRRNISILRFRCVQASLFILFVELSTTSHSCSSYTPARPYAFEPSHSPEELSLRALCSLPQLLPNLQKLCLLGQARCVYDCAPLSPPRLSFQCVFVNHCFLSFHCPLADFCETLSPLSHLFHAYRWETPVLSLRVMLWQARSPISPATRPSRAGE